MVRFFCKDEIWDFSKLRNGRGGNRANETLDDCVVGHSFRLRLEIDAQPVTKNRNGNPPNVLDRHGESAVHRGDRFAALDEELTRTRTGTPIDQIPNERRGRFVFRAGGADQRGHVLHDVLAHRHGIHEFLNVRDGAGREDLLHLDFVGTGRLRKNPFLFFLCGVIDLDVEHE